MPRWRVHALRATLLVLVAVAVGLAVVTHMRAHELITNPRAIRKMPARTPADYNMAFDDVAVTTSDGLRLYGWFVPSSNGASVMLIHGYKDDRSSMLRVADLLPRHGYGLLILSLRAHDRSDGEMITFGHYEIRDLDAWYAFESTHAGVDPAELGVFGVSMGGSLALQFAAQNPRVTAVVADSAFSSLNDTVATSVRFFTGLPAFPFAPMIEFWTEREAGFDASEIDAKRWAPAISPRPVFLLQGDADVVVSPQSGERLFAAAREPKEFWHEADVGHAEFLKLHPQEFEERVVGFLDRYVRHER